MKQLLAFFTVATLIFVACSNPKKENKSSEQPIKTGGWLPAPGYRPTSETAMQLNDSAAVLQITALQDPTLDVAQRAKMMESAFQMLQEALKLDPNYGMAMTNLSTLYLEKRDTGKALELMQQRLKVEPELAEGWQAVGFFSDMRGDSAKALSYYQKSIEIYDSRLKMGKKYTNPDDLMYYYDNWSGKAFSLLLLGRTADAHNSIRALLDEAGVILGENAATYAAMLDKDRWSLLLEMKQD